MLVADDRWTGRGGPEPMLCWEEFVELRNLHERGWSVSAIARHLGKDRKTVRRYLADPDARPGVRKPTGKLIDPYAAYVEARLEDNPHLAGVRPDCVACHGPEPAESVVMRHRPGAAQADWSPFYWTPAGSTVEVEVQLFAIQLCRPQLLYAAFFERQSWAHLAAGHLAAFDYFAGVPTEVRYDRTTQVFRPRSTEPTPAFADFAGYYRLQAGAVRGGPVALQGPDRAGVPLRGHLVLPNR
jgi:transposase